MALDTSSLPFVGCTVLVVDDYRQMQQLVSEILTLYGAQVVCADDGVSALEVARATRPDFIITDLMMPMRDGWDLLFELRSHVETAHIPVIAMTAERADGNYERALMAGFDHYLTKPLHPETFVRDLSRIVARLPRSAAAG